MSKNLEVLIEKAETIDCGNYQLRVSELIELADKCQNNFIDGSFLFFKIGFLKGQRAEIARQKKKRQSVNA